MTDDASYLLTIRCPDAPGIVAAVATFLADHGFSVTEAHQHDSLRDGRFFMRLTFAGDRARVPEQSELEKRFAPIARRFVMETTLRDRASRPRVLILVSKFGHCLHDLLLRWQAGQLDIDIPAVVSNHDDLRSFADWVGVPFHHWPVDAATRDAQEDRLLALIESAGIDLVVLARYMQVLSPRLCAALSGRCINIHHSSLPSFKGAKPYHQAYERGVKIIGATAHYVTTDLDEGPIIEQQTRRVSHARNPEELVAIGQEVESSVLTRAVRWHIDGRVLLNGNRTVVFD